MIGDRIHRARKAAGLSLRALAEQTGVSHTTLSKFEHGAQVPSSRQLIELSGALGVRNEYLLRPTEVELGEVTYRAHRKLSAKLRDRIHADVLDQLERWHELLALFPGDVLPAFRLPDELPGSIEDDDDLEAAAEAMRRAWRLGDDPIPDLIDTLESNGILVVQTNAEGGGQFNGLSAMAGEDLARPVIVVHSAWPGDRQRFTLAHELGHLVLAGCLAGDLDIEKACNRFAGALLLPALAARQALGTNRQMLEPKELQLLKSEYGLSMQGCLFRALQAGIISSTTHQELFRAFTRHGWRTREPGPDYPPERTVRFAQLVYHALAEDFIGESKAAELLEMPVSRFHRERRMEGTDADPRR
ncbi:MAG: XRE family transcriptional regulator [Halofilum sp. (in: g-proteobacteria)]|nr:XRE family transcriptional regulator [Halofilum sp. (in: g-proteobacteria)]